MSTEPRALPLILCVDDESNVLEALKRQLRHRFQVVMAPGPAPGLEAIENEGPFEVVVSDFRMPGMDGATFLARVRERARDTVRVLLTGQADMNGAIAAVNEGAIFRFLTKPCPPEVLLKALEAAVEQHRLITAERVLLEETLRGSVKTLTDILALANPAAFGRATRARQHVCALAERLSVENSWQLDVAAMLSQIGCVTLPPETAAKLYHGRGLTESEQQMADKLPAVAGQLLASIPRLEGVRAILVYQRKRFDGTGTPRDAVGGEDIPWGARALQIVLDYDTLEAQGVAPDLAVDTLRGREGWYDPALLDAFAKLMGGSGRQAVVREMRLRDVRPGMILAQDVVSGAGVLLIARGQEVTAGLMERIRNFAERAGVKDPIRVILPAVSGLGTSTEGQDGEPRTARR